MAAPGPSERGLEVGVQDGFSIWRLDVIGSFLKFQQHGHLKRGEQMDPWDSGRTRDLAAGLCAPQSPGRGGGERSAPATWGTCTVEQVCGAARLHRCHAVTWGCLTERDTCACEVLSAVEGRRPGTGQLPLGDRRPGNMADSAPFHVTSPRPASVSL